MGSTLMKRARRTQSLRHAFSCIVMEVDRCNGVRNGLWAWQSLAIHPIPHKTEFRPTAARI